MFSEFICSADWWLQSVISRLQSNQGKPGTPKIGGGVRYISTAPNPRAPGWHPCGQLPVIYSLTSGRLSGRSGAGEIRRFADDLSLPGSLMAEDDHF